MKKLFEKLKRTWFSVVLGVFIGIARMVYDLGYKAGSDTVQAEAAQAVEALKQQHQVQEEEHKAKQQEIANELAQVREQHEVATTDLRARYEQRLLQSARRSQVYQRQAQAGAAATRDLASHAARLDRALEEGRELVGELGATLRLRDEQLKLLGQQIHNDRKLLQAETD